MATDVHSKNRRNCGDAIRQHLQPDMHSVRTDAAAYYARIKDKAAHSTSLSNRHSEEAMCKRRRRQEKRQLGTSLVNRGPDVVGWRTLSQLYVHGDTCTGGASAPCMLPGSTTEDSGQDPQHCKQCPKGRLASNRKMRQPPTTARRQSTEER